MSCLYVEYEAVPLEMLATVFELRCPLSGVALVVFPGCPEVAELLPGENGDMLVEFDWGSCPIRRRGLVDWLEHNRLAYTVTQE